MKSTLSHELIFFFLSHLYIDRSKNGDASYQTENPALLLQETVDGRQHQWSLLPVFILFGVSAFRSLVRRRNPSGSNRSGLLVGHTFEQQFPTGVHELFLRLPARLDVQRAALVHPRQHS